MKLLVLNYEYPPLGGGAGVVTRHLSEGLANAGHDVTVITTWFADEKEIEERGKLRIIRLKSKRKYKYRSNIFEMLSWKGQAKYFLNRYCARNKFDLCLANFSIPGGSIALSLKQAFGLKYVILSHGHDIPWMFPRQMFFFHALLYFQIKRICSESKLNVMLTGEMKYNIDRLLGQSKAEKNIIIPNGADFDTFRPDISKRGKPFKVIFVGRLVAQKDPLTFLKAIEIFLKQNRDIEVNVIGDGRLRERLECFISKCNLNGFVKMSGWLSSNEIVSELQSAHVCVSPSLYEAMSVSTVESVASGCFLISTPQDSMQEMIDPEVNGSFVRIRSADEIAEKLQWYYKEKYLSGYAVPPDRIRKRREKFSWEYLVPEYDRQLTLSSGS